MRPIIVLIILAACASLASCGADAGGLFGMDYSPARLAESSEIAGCKALGQVTGYSETTSSRNVPLARLTARDDLLERAGQMGATHVIFIKYAGARRPLALGRAYSCK